MHKKKIFGKRSSWDRWDAQGYLDEYFRELNSDVKLTTKFVSRELLKFKPDSVSKVLEIGSGPTIIGVVGTTPYAKKIFVSDYLQKNLDEIKIWKNKGQQMFNFNNIISYTLKLEGFKPTLRRIARRANDLRRKLKGIIKCDIGDKDILNKVHGPYPLIISLYCADSITGSKITWRRYMKNILNLLSPSGTILIAALRKCKFYNVGASKFPSANIDESELKKTLIQNGFLSKDIHIRVVKTPGNASQGFSGLIFARAEKNDKINKQ